jgi:hypothetical protein
MDAIRHLRVCVCVSSSPHNAYKYLLSHSSRLKRLPSYTIRMALSERKEDQLVARVILE